MKLYAPAEYWKLSQSALQEICNGCGPAEGWKQKYIPDHILWISIKEACDIHDYMYHIGQTNTDREEADRVFLNNMLRIVEAESRFWLLRLLRRRLALDYYCAVRDFGAPYFWEDKNLPGTMVDPLIHCFGVV
jgi:hypothetical protein